MSPAGGKRGKKAAEAAPQLPRRALPKDVEDKLISVYTTSAREAKYRLRSGVGKVPCLIAFWYVGKERTYRRTDVKVWLVEPSTPKGQALSAAFCTVDVMLHAQLRVAVLTRVVRYMAKASTANITVLRSGLRNAYEAAKAEVLGRSVDGSSGNEGSDDDDIEPPAPMPAPNPAPEQVPPKRDLNAADAATIAAAAADFFQDDEDDVVMFEGVVPPAL